MAEKKAKRPRKHRVVAAVYRNSSLFELAVATEVFGWDYSGEIGIDWYDYRVASIDDEPTNVRGHLSFTTPHGLEALEWADTIIVPPTRDRRCCTSLEAGLRKAHKAGKRIVSLCSGVFALAQSGILDGLEVTTHWHHSCELTDRFPAVRVDPDVLFVENENIFTSAGSAASLDLCLHLVRLDHGAEVANKIARSLVVPPQRDGGQAQYVDQPIVPTIDAELFADTLAWAEANLGQSISVDDLAERSAMSPRTFARRFKQTTGTTPHSWLSQQRVVLAQRMLETTDHSIEYIADQAGFGSATNMRTHFQRTLKTTPSRYRHAFCCLN